MTEKEILRRVNEIERLVVGDFDVFYKLKKLSKDLSESIYKKELRKTYKSDAYRAAQRILKRSKSRYGKVCITNENGKQYISDGICCIRYNQPLDFFYDEDLIQKPNFDYEFVFNKVFEGENIKLDLMSLGELRAEIALRKSISTSKNSKDLGVLELAGQGGISVKVDPLILLDVVEALPDCECYVPTNPDVLYFISDEPVYIPYFKAENGIALLCPKVPLP